MTVDRTFLLNSAYDEIREGRWWLPADAATIDNEELYAQVKAPSRIRDLTGGDLKYRWTETGALDFYRYNAPIFTRLADHQSFRWIISQGGKSSCR